METEKLARRGSFTPSSVSEAQKAVPLILVGMWCEQGCPDPTKARVPETPTGDYGDSVDSGHVLFK